VNDDNAQARMTATGKIVEYLHGEGSLIPRDTAGHATEIAQVLSNAGLLIDPGYQVAISPDRLNELKHAEVMLAALNAAGVDNWDGYDNAMFKLHGVDETTLEILQRDGEDLGPVTEPKPSEDV